MSVPKNTDYYKIKQCINCFAGPFANLLVAGILVAFFPDQALNFDFFSGVRIASTLFLANGFCFVWSLWPRTIQTARGKLSTDGLEMWKTLFLSPNEIEKLPLAYFLYESSGSYAQNKFEDAKAWAEKGLILFPDDRYLLNAKAGSLMGLKQLSVTREIYSSLLKRPDLQPNERGLFANNLAYVNTLIGGADLIEEADKYSQEALKSLPSYPYYKGTRGCVLVELGRFDDGIKLLKEALAQHELSQSKALNACHIAIAEKRRGNLDESAKFAALAKSLDAKCMLLDRVN